MMSCWGWCRRRGGWRTGHSTWSWPGSRSSPGAAPRPVRGVVVAGKAKRPGRRDGEFADDELGMELVMNRRAAGDRMDLAHELATRLPRTFAALAAGLIGADRAAVIWSCTRFLSGAGAAHADERAGGGGAGDCAMSSLSARAHLAGDQAWIRRAWQRRKEEGPPAEVESGSRPAGNCPGTCPSAAGNAVRGRGTGRQGVQRRRDAKPRCAPPGCRARWGPCGYWRCWTGPAALTPSTASAPPRQRRRKRPPPRRRLPRR